MSGRYELIQVPVRGGDLTVGRWAGGPRTVLAVHGITANHLSMAALADALGDDVTVLAPDLRGRGGSAGLPGPWGMAIHAEDVVAVLDHAGVDQAVFVGHSMGGFVSMVTAHRHPQRVARLVLVDGGIPLDLSALGDLPVDQLTHSIIGPALERLRLTFASEQAYLDYWRPHPAFVGHWNDDVEAHYRYDLVGEPPEMRSGVCEEAVLADAGDELKNDAVTRSLDAFGHEAVLLRAQRGILNQEPPLYTDAWLEQWTTRLETLRVQDVEDVNHYTILLTPEGARIVADAVRG